MSNCRCCHSAAIPACAALTTRSIPQHASLVQVKAGVSMFSSLSWTPRLNLLSCFYKEPFAKVLDGNSVVFLFGLDHGSVHRFLERNADQLSSIAQYMHLCLQDRMSNESHLAPIPDYKVH